VESFLACKGIANYHHGTPSSEEGLYQYQQYSVHRSSVFWHLVTEVCRTRRVGAVTSCSVNSVVDVAGVACALSLLLRAPPFVACDFL